MQRRQIVRGVAAVVAAAAATAVSAQNKGQTEHQHASHHHGSGKHSALMASASHCLMTGEVCLEHCYTLLGEGDKVMAACARSVSELIAVCTALRSLAALNAPTLPRLAKVALESCLSCEKECRKHDKHKVCIDCADACKECAAECRKLGA